MAHQFVRGWWVARLLRLLWFFQLLLLLWLLWHAFIARHARDGFGLLCFVALCRLLWPLVVMWFHGCVASCGISASCGFVALWLCDFVASVASPSCVWSISTLWLHGISWPCSFFVTSYLVSWHASLFHCSFLHYIFFAALWVLHCLMVWSVVLWP